MLIYNKERQRKRTNYNPEISYPAKLTFNDNMQEFKEYHFHEPFPINLLETEFLHIQYDRKDINVKICGEPALHLELN